MVTLSPLALLHSRLCQCPLSTKLMWWDCIRVKYSLIPAHPGHIRSQCHWAEWAPPAWRVVETGTFSLPAPAHNLLTVGRWVTGVSREAGSSQAGAYATAQEPFVLEPGFRVSGPRFPPAAGCPSWGQLADSAPLATPTFLLPSP